MSLALDREKHFVHVPLITGPRPSTTQLIGIVLAKLAAPLADGLIGHDHAPFKEEFFHITQTQAEAKVQPHSVTDDLNGKAVVLIAAAWGWGVHVAILLHHVGSN